MTPLAQYWQRISQFTALICRNDYWRRISEDGDERIMVGCHRSRFWNLGNHEPQPMAPPIHPANPHHPADSRRQATRLSPPPPRRDIQEGSAQQACCGGEPLTAPPPTRIVLFLFPIPYFLRHLYLTHIYFQNLAVKIGRATCRERV